MKPKPKTMMPRHSEHDDIGESTWQSIRNWFIGLWLLVDKHWKSMQRDVDMVVLWPACLDASINRWHALRAFTIHVRVDSAWHVPLEEMTEDQRRLALEMIGGHDISEVKPK